MIFSEDFWNMEGEMKQVLPVSTGLSWVRMAPLLANAERDYLVPLIGSALMDEITEIYKADPSERTAVERELLFLAQRAEANLAFWSNFDAFNLRISDQGFQRQESDSWHPAYKYQEDTLRKGFVNAGLNALDAMLALLETHLCEFGAFAQSPAYTLAQHSIVRSTDEVQDVYDIGRSRLIYLRLRALMPQQEELTLQPLLGNTLYAGLRSWLDDGTVGDYTAEIWESLRCHCRRVLVMACVIHLLRTTGSVTDRGAYFASYQAAGGGNMAFGPVSDVRLQLMLTDAEKMLQGHIGRLNQFVKTTMGDADGGDPLRVLHRDNDTGKAFWA